MHVFSLKRVRTFQALRSRSFLFFWLGQTISAMGNDAFGIALAWEVLFITKSAELMALVRIIEEVPRIVFLLLGGVAADRLPQRKIIFWVDAGRGVLVLLVTFLAWHGWLQVWLIIVIGLIFGVSRGFFGPAYRSLFPQLVESREQLPSANAMNGLSKQGSQLIGPPLGSFLFVAMSAVGAFLFDALTFIFSACCMFGVQAPAQSSSQAPDEATTQSSQPRKLFRGMGDDLRQGIHYVLHLPWLWLSILVISLANSGVTGLDQVALPKLLVTNFLN